MSDADNMAPDWVLIEAANRCDWPQAFGPHAENVEELRRDYEKDAWHHRPFRALCDMIAKHEQPPVDPDVEAVKRMLCAFYGEAKVILSADAVARALAQYKQERSNG